MRYRAVFGLLLMSVIPAGSQQASTFEVASIRFGDPQPTSASLRFLPNGEMVARNFPLDLILQEVYGVRQFQIAGLERWTSRWSTTRLTIQAKASGATSEDELKRMAQGLLSLLMGGVSPDRFTSLLADVDGPRRSPTST